MSYLDPRVIRLRITCVTIIQSLMDTVRYLSEKEALEALYKRSRQRHQPTGFRMEDFNRFRECYRKTLTSAP